MAFISIPGNSIPAVTNALLLTKPRLDGVNILDFDFPDSSMLSIFMVLNYFFFIGTRRFGLWVFKFTSPWGGRNCFCAILGGVKYKNSVLVLKPK